MSQVFPSKWKKIIYINAIVVDIVFVKYFIYSLQTNTTVTDISDWYDNLFEGIFMKWSAASSQIHLMAILSEGK